MLCSHGDVGGAARQIDVLDARQDLEADVGQSLSHQARERREKFDGQARRSRQTHRAGHFGLRAHGQSIELAGPARHLLGSG